MVTSQILLLLACFFAGHASIPPPLALWTFQEATGAPRRTSPTSVFSYTLLDGNASAPIERAEGGVFGPYSAHFPARAANSTARLHAPRATVPALTSALAGRTAQVALFAWVRTLPGAPAAGMIAGVWDEHNAARQYALFASLGACAAAPAYHSGAAAHISNCGGATPGQQYCTTVACDPRALTGGDWHCLATVYDGLDILSYVNGSTVPNGKYGPFHYPGGIFSPEAKGRLGAEFGVGRNAVTRGGGTGGAAEWASAFVGDIGGIAVFNVSLSAADIASVCAWAAGF